MHILVSLTASESKRLIAKGVAQCDTVRRAVEHGIIAIGSGTTNGYVIEELTGERIDKKTMVTGRTLPSGYSGPAITYTGQDLILRKGQRISGVKATEYIGEMGPGDVFMKGLNALNYERRQGAVLIGHPTGGTIGAVIGTIVARRIRFLHPAGLEKSVGTDLARWRAHQLMCGGWANPALVPGDLLHGDRGAGRAGGRPGRSGRGRGHRRRRGCRVAGLVRDP